ncbi:hypothetical protein FOZ62_030102 [Perkinsus olseni]|uniref:C3H1-type domain-containing protein n=1 Tax=Perkinsus olseni TaxID=32597 RepID=A0A7J6TTW7_PEROL|nr:hypothetical protein FOZ62_030102 [Perkinsus olseni]
MSFNTGQLGGDGDFKEQGQQQQQQQHHLLSQPHYSVRNTFINFTDPKPPLDEIYGLDANGNARPSMALKARSMPEGTNIDRTASQLASMLFRGGAAFGLQPAAPEVATGPTSILHQPFSGPPATIPEARPEYSSGSSVQSDENHLSSVVVGGVPSDTIMPEGQSGSPFDTSVTGIAPFDSGVPNDETKKVDEVVKNVDAPSAPHTGSNKRATGPTHISMKDLSEDDRDRLLSLIPRDPQTGKLLSAGSIVHELGTCRPCVFANNSERPCVYGVECLFCHFHHDIRKRSRMSRKQRQEARKMRETQNSIGCSLGSPVLRDDASAEEIFQCLVGHAHAVELQKITLDHLLDSSSGMPVPPFYTPTSSSPPPASQEKNNSVA